MVARMRELGFDEKNIEKALHVEALPYRNINHLPAYRKRLQGEGQLGQAIAFWLLSFPWNSRPCDSSWATRPWRPWKPSTGWRPLLHPFRPLKGATCSQGVRSRVDLYPCCGQYFFTDIAYGLNPWAEQVYWLGGDSYTLARCTPRSPIKAALDICTGSGVQAVLARAHSGHSVGVDINERALQFSRLNARLNGFDDTEFILGDCYNSLNQKFNLITLNPPFVPSPKHIKELYRTGGESGETVTERVVRGLPTYLNENGVFSMTTEAPIMRNASPPRPPARVDREWLGPGGPIQAGNPRRRLSSGSCPGHQRGPPFTGTRIQQMVGEVYQNLGITSMVSAQFYAVRLPKSCQDWRSERIFRHPNRDYSQWLAHWLEALQAWHSPWPQEFRPGNPRADQGPLLFQRRGGGGIPLRGLEPHHPNPLGPLQARLLKAVEGGATLGELVNSPDEEKALAELGGEMAFTTWAANRTS